MDSTHLSPPFAVPGRPDRARGLAGSVAMRPARTIFSAVVFKGETEIGIEHHGELYRLKITRQGKLILTK